MSTGDRTILDILGRISKRGNGYLRTLFVQAARVTVAAGKLAEASSSVKNRTGNRASSSK
jgi:transposase